MHYSLSTILNLFFPKNCLGCHKAGSYICQDCFNSSGRANQVCIYCKRYSFMGNTHPSCMRRDYIDGIFAPFTYDGVIRKAILALKYRFASDITNDLASHYAAYLKKSNYPVRDAIITPIPLHQKRENWRGFNQSRKICGKIAEIMHWQFIPDLLVKAVSTKPQVGLKGDARRENVKNVFSLNTDHRPLNTNYIIFDDVATTGSTLIEAGRVLKKSGVPKVWGLTIAK